MRIVAISCVRDESDIIEPFVRHTLAIADRLVVLDNGSSDGTRQLLDALTAEGLPLDVVDDPSPGKYLSERLTRLMREIALPRHAAEWILPLDADEFVVPGTEGLIPSGVDATRPMLMPWRSYVPDDGDDVRECNPVLRIRRRLAEETETVKKVIVPRAPVAAPDAVICQGSHELLVTGRACPSDLHPTACLAHYPIRSAVQFLAKTVIGHLQNEVMPYRQSYWGWHHRENYERLKADPAGFLAGLTQIGTRYSCLPRDAAPQLVDDPLLYRGGPLRYTSTAPPEPLHAWPPVLRYLQDLARRYALQASAREAGEHDELFAFLRRQLSDRDTDMEKWRVEAIELRTELDGTRAQLARTREDLAHAHRSHGLMRQSPTWKVGRAMLLPVRVLRDGWAARHRLRLPISFRR